MYTLVLRHLSRVHLSRANFLYSHDLSDAQLTWNKVAFWVPGIIIACCVLLELTIPRVNTLPDQTDTNDSMKVYKDPWIMMAAWHCAACQVLCSRFSNTRKYFILINRYKDFNSHYFANFHFCSYSQILLYFHLPTLAPFVERALGETVVWTGLALLVNTSTIIISAPPLGS